MTIILVDKQPITRLGLRLLFRGLFKQANIMEFECLNQVKDLCSTTSQTILVLGFYNSDKTPHIRYIISAVQKFPLASIIVYDDNSDDPLVFKYFQIGISGYLAKQSSLHELSYCINDVVSGKKYIPVNILLHDHKNDLKNNPFQRVIPSQKLSFQEYEIATYLGKGMRNAWIARKLQIKPTTVSYYKYKIFKKLNVSNILKLGELMESDSYSYKEKIT
ncbi:DNA-binding NarL/FixJ family response regulator [Dyadobacter jejuensis]|uniref:DNA-binding NarL/FixJ family response regulator n=2 Tax=Dyadobacter jejuensis TaxID=1082580 RepID=A0A316AVG4_9BACT|nr:DNA-binding NarL/FixJ family response regulator [Dyadobacter jejuensis]